MSRNGYADALDNCIGLIDKGMPVEECLLTYPEYAAQLDGPLHVAQTLRVSRAQVSVPPPTMRRDAFLSAVAAEARAEASAPPVATPVVTPTTPLWAPLRRFAMVPYALPAVLAMLILGGAAWGVSAATGTSGPGSWIAGSSTHDDRVEVRGTIAAISPTSVTVSTLDGDVTAAITADTEFDGPNGIDGFAVGDTVKLSTLPAADGSLVVHELQHEDVDGVDDEAVPTGDAEETPGTGDGEATDEPDGANDNEGTDEPDGDNHNEGVDEPDGPNNDGGVDEPDGPNNDTGVDAAEPEDDGGDPGHGDD